MTKLSIHHYICYISLNRFFVLKNEARDLIYYTLLLTSLQYYHHYEKVCWIISTKEFYQISAVTHWGVQDVSVHVSQVLNTFVSQIQSKLKWNARNSCILLNSQSSFWKGLLLNFVDKDYLLPVTYYRLNDFRFCTALKPNCIFCILYFFTRFLRWVVLFSLKNHDRN